MKCAINKGEMWPVFYIETDTGTFSYGRGHKVDIPNDKIAWIRNCEEEHYKMQDYLSNLLKEDDLASGC